jgi:Uma2 family endonuclease
MSVQSTQPSEYVVLYDVPWDTYEGVLEALPDHYLHHAYDRGTFELRSLLWNVSWEAYEQLLAAFGDYQLAHTYDRGTLEILMSPRVDHDWVKSILGRMVEMVSFVLDIPIKSVGSTTLRRRDVRCGLQPDEGYYIENERQVRGKLTFDPDSDPLPDLVIEVDVTNKSVTRLPVYAS